MNYTEKLSKRKMKAINCTLSKRDRAILQSLKNCRLLSTDQVRRLHFSVSANPDAARRAATRALFKLMGKGLVQQIERHIGGVGSGSSAYVWHLKKTGAELLYLCEHGDAKPYRQRYYEHTEIFARHNVAVSEAYTRLYELSCAKGMEALRVEWEPRCWRELADAYGASTYLKPDLYVVTDTKDYEDHWFFEVDLDTEAPVRVIRKCEQYIRHYRSGHEQKARGVFPRIVWIVPDEKRRDCLRRHIEENLPGYTDLFTVAVWDELEALITGSGEP